MQLNHRINLILLLAIFLVGCSSLPNEIIHPIEPILVAQPTTLSKLTNNHQPQISVHKMSAIHIQNTGWDALAQRLALIESAENSIDIQYYIWNADVSGYYLATRLIAAANRGVKVRVLLDDININERESLLAELDLHPQIDIRIFNPIPNRRGLTKWFSFFNDFSRLNRRMHNKSFTVDGVLSVVGGRNVGDEYFDLSADVNFRDRDVLVMGKVVTDIHTSFLNYWNSPWSYPINLLTDSYASTVPVLQKLEMPHYKGYPDLPEGKEVSYHFLKELMAQMFWVNAHYISDQPVPIDADNTNEPKATAKYLAELARKSETQILLESAYLIFDDHQLKAFQSISNRNVQVKALTNSLASNDLVTNHSGYADRRKEMLEHGIELFEMKPSSKMCEKSTRDLTKCAPTTGYGLHAKSSVFDRKIAAIGSYNFNLRSTYLNTESLLIIENQVIAESLANDIERAMNQDNSWSLHLHNGNVQWRSDGESWDNEPKTELMERIKSRLLQLLPLEKYL